MRNREMAGGRNSNFCGWRKEEPKGIFYLLTLILNGRFPGNEDVSKALLELEIVMKSAGKHEEDAGRTQADSFMTAPRRVGSPSPRREEAKTHTSSPSVVTSTKKESEEAALAAKMEGDQARSKRAEEAVAELTKHEGSSLGGMGWLQGTGDPLANPFEGSLLGGMRWLPGTQDQTRSNRKDEVAKNTGEEARAMETKKNFQEDEAERNRAEEEIVTAKEMEGDQTRSKRAEEAVAELTKHEGSSLGGMGWLQGTGDPLANPFEGSLLGGMRWLPGTQDQTRSNRKDEVAKNTGEEARAVATKKNFQENEAERNRAEEEIVTAAKMEGGILGADETAATNAEMHKLFAASKELLDRLPSSAAESLLLPIARSESPIASAMRRLLSPQKKDAEDEESAAAAGIIVSDEQREAQFFDAPIQDRPSSQSLAELLIDGRFMYRHLPHERREHVYRALSQSNSAVSKMIRCACALTLQCAIRLHLARHQARLQCRAQGSHASCFLGLSSRPPSGGERQTRTEILNFEEESEDGSRPMTPQPMTPQMSRPMTPQMPLVAFEESSDGSRPMTPQVPPLPLTPSQMIPSRGSSAKRHTSKLADTEEQRSTTVQCELRTKSTLSSDLSIESALESHDPKLATLKLEHVNELTALRSEIQCLGTDKDELEACSTQMLRATSNNCSTLLVSASASPTEIEKGTEREWEGEEETKSTGKKGLARTNAGISAESASGSENNF